MGEDGEQGWPPPVLTWPIFCRLRIPYPIILSKDTINFEFPHCFTFYTPGELH